MSRPAVDPVEKAINAYRALTAEQKVMYHKVLHYIGIDQPVPAAPRQRKPRQKPAEATA